MFFKLKITEAELEFKVLNNDKPVDKVNKLKYFDNSLVDFLSDNLLKVFGQNK